MTPGAFVKIAVRLVRDQDGYPPADWEHIWATHHDANRFVIDNVPFFAKGLAAGDLVEAQLSGPNWVFDRVVTSGGHSTLRVILFEEKDKADVRKKLAEFGCESEASHVPNLISVDVPSGTDYTRVLEYLKTAEAEGLLEYEEGVVRHSC